MVNNDRDNSIWNSIAASSVGAMSTTLLRTPFDVIKIRLQVQAMDSLHLSSVPEVKHTGAKHSNTCTLVKISNGLGDYWCDKNTCMRSRSDSVVRASSPSMISHPNTSLLGMAVQACDCNKSIVIVSRY